jgi:hypothetical protein
MVFVLYRLSGDYYIQCFFSGGCRGTHTPKHFVHSLHLFFSNLNYKMVIFLSQTESTPKHLFRKKALIISMTMSVLWDIIPYI